MSLYSEVAGVGTGVWQSFEKAAEKTVHVRRTFVPDPGNKAVYDRGYGTYRELYENLKGMMNNAQ